MIKPFMIMYHLKQDTLLIAQESPTGNFLIWDSDTWHFYVVPEKKFNRQTIFIDNW